MIPADGIEVLSTPVGELLSCFQGGANISYFCVFMILNFHVKSLCYLGLTSLWEKKKWKTYHVLLKSFLQQFTAFKKNKWSFLHFNFNKRCPTHEMQCAFCDFFLHVHVLQ